MSNDAKDRLPPAAAAKLQRLTMAAADTRALMQSTLKAIEDSENRLASAKNACECIPADDVAEAELHGLRQLAAQRRAAHDTAAQMVTHVQAWLRRLPLDLKLVERNVPPIADTGLDQAVELLRADISAVDGDIARLKSASLSKADLHARAKEYVASLAQKGAPRVQCVGDRLDFNFMDPTAFSVSVNDVVRALAWASEPAPKGEPITINELADELGMSAFAARRRLRESEEPKPGPRWEGNAAWAKHIKALLKNGAAPRPEPAVPRRPEPKPRRVAKAATKPRPKPEPPPPEVAEVPAPPEAA